MLSSLRQMQKQAFEGTDRLRGGRADKKPRSAFDPMKLQEGTKHEMEHTSETPIAEEIASDHLAEDPDYYRKLKQIERPKTAAYDAGIERALADYGLKK